MLELIKGAKIKNCSILEEGYKISKNNILVSINYYKIRRVINDFININKNEKMFLFIEVPTNINEDEVYNNIIKKIQNDVYYLDDLSDKDMRRILDVYDDILINDGLVNFGIGTFIGDKIGKYSYNTMNIYTTEDRIYIYENILKNNNIELNDDLVTGYDIINNDNPGISSRYQSNGINIYDVIEELKKQGLYRSKKIPVEDNKFELTKVDIAAIEEEDYIYINNKGAEYYNNGNYEQAIEYYRLAMAMGDKHAIANIGYCYMYGRSVEKNMNLALAYFKIAAKYDDIDALYKLGDIYKNGYGLETNFDLALYYYEKALNLIEEDIDVDEFDYPSLYFSLAKEYMPDGLLDTNIEKSYNYLKIARAGYEYSIEEYKATYYEKMLEATNRLLDNEIFDELKKSDEENMIDDE